MGHCVDGAGCCALGALFVESHAMGLLTFGLNVTLDGCIDHTQAIVDDELHDYWTELMDQSGAMLFGRNTYELMEGAWPAVARDEKAPRAMREWAQKLEAKTKYVVSGTRSDFPWQNTIKVEGDLREAISALKAKTERGVLVGARYLRGEPGVVDHLGQCLGPPWPVHDHRQPRTAADEHHLPAAGQHTGQVGHRGRHRLGREERELAHATTVSQR